MAKILASNLTQWDNNY